MKKIPKINKNLNNFLLKSSRGIILGTAVGSSILGVPFVPSDGDVGDSLSFLNLPIAQAVHTSSGYPYGISVITGASCAHISGVVNGHMSATPNPAYSYGSVTAYGHASHESHASHSSHCNCSRWR